MKFLPNYFDMNACEKACKVSIQQSFNQLCNCYKTPLPCTSRVIRTSISYIYPQTPFASKSVDLGVGRSGGIHLHRLLLLVCHLLLEGRRLWLVGSMLLLVRDLVGVLVQHGRRLGRERTRLG